MVSRALLRVALLSLTVALYAREAAAEAQLKCPALPTLEDDDISSLPVHSYPGKQNFVKVKKAALLNNVPKDATIKDYCVVTSYGLAADMACKEAKDTSQKTGASKPYYVSDALKLYYCKPAAKSDASSQAPSKSDASSQPASKSDASSQSASKNNASSQAHLEPVKAPDDLKNDSISEIYVSYQPLADFTGLEVFGLRFEGADGKRLKTVPAVGSSEGYDDARYKLNLYTGANVLFTGEDFSKTFGEAVVRVESRYYDQRRDSFKPVERSHGRWYWVGRGYADAGLSSTTACGNSTQTVSNSVRVGTLADPSGACDSKAGLQGTRSFVGRLGLGIGAVVPVTADVRDTNAFTFLLLARVGETSVPKLDAQHPGFLAFGDFFGLHVENEAGHFAGAFVTTGVGQSDQFVAQRSARWKTEALIPFTEPDKSARLALRFQIDTVMPFGAKLNRDVGSTDDERLTSHRLIRAGDIKISFLLNVDIRKFFDVLNGPAKQ
jgi:hypothetical protein